MLKKIIPHKISINRAVVLLTLADIFSWGMFVVLNAIIGIYLSERLGQGSVRIVGVGMSIYLLTRGIFQLPLGKFLDNFDKDKDEIIFLAMGSILMGISYLFYPVIRTASFYYLLQFVFGLGASMNLVSWRKLFAQNLDKNEEGLEYGLYGMTMSMASALFAVLAGSIANLSQYYFDMVVMSIGIIMMLGSIFSLLIFSVRKRRSNN